MIARIGRVPRLPVIELEGMGSVARVGEDFDQAPWPQGITLERAFSSYLREHVALKPKTEKRIRNDIKRASQSAREAFRILDPQTLIETMTRNDGRTYAAARMAEGVVAASARRELSVISAAMLHAKKEGRVAKVAALWKPEPAAARLMFLSRDEYQALLKLPMSRRMRIFWLLAFGTGARSEAIEEARWEQIDWQARTIDYRIKGVIYKNKRRVVAPLHSRLYDRLRGYYEIRDPADPYIIGRGNPRRNAVSTTYHEASRCVKTLGIYKPGLARHVARHSFATWLLQERVPIAEVAALLGDQVSMIERHYGHIMPSDLHRAAAVLERIG